MTIGDRHWGPRDVADDLRMFIGHDGTRQFANSTQGPHDELLGVAGVRCIGEGGNRDRLDGSNVGWGFVSELEGHGLVLAFFLKI